MPRHAAAAERPFPSRRELRSRRREASPAAHCEIAAHPEVTAGTEFPAPSAATAPTAVVVDPAARQQPAQRQSAVPEDRPEQPSAAQPRSRETLGVVYFPPLLPPDDDEPATPAATGERSPDGRSQPRRTATVAAILGVTALTLTMALPGVDRGETEHAAAASLQAQLLNTGGTGDAAASFDALNSVSAEVGDGDMSFENFTDASVQFPFAASVPLTDSFGERSWPVAGFHDAQDFAAPDGTPIQSIADGRVIEAGVANDGCGFGLKVEHQIDGLEVTARYCHMQMNSHDYRVGDTVRVGDPVGRVGNTGLSFGSHLHFALTVDGERTDPMPFLLKYNRLTRAGS